MDTYELTLVDSNYPPLKVQVTSAGLTATEVLRAACAAMRAHGFSTKTIENAVENLYEEGTY